MYKSEFRVLFFLLCLFGCGSWGLMNAQSADVTEACVPFEINFTGPGGLSEYFWDFGDGGSSILQNPQHIYVASGTFEVVLREGSGGDEIGTLEINIYDKPDLEIALDTNRGCAPFTVEFQNLSTANAAISLDEFVWIFGDGSTEIVTSDADVSNEYNVNGPVNVGLQWISSTPNCSNTETFQEVLEVGAPQAIFTTIPDTPSICEPPLTVLIGTNNSTGSGISYLWDLNGTSTSDQFPPATTFDDEGLFGISLTVTDTLGCSDTQVQPVSIGGVVASFEIPDTVCVETPFVINNNSSAGQYIWSFGGAIPESLPLPTSPTVRFPTEGNYEISLTVLVDGGACQADTTITVFADEVDVDIIADPTYTCQDSLIVNYNIESSAIIESFTWNFSDGSTNSTDLEVTDTLVDYDTTKYHLNEERLLITQFEVITNFGCVGRTFHIDTIRQPESRFMPDISRGCVPLTVTFADSSISNEEIVRWEWDFGDGTTIDADDGEDQVHTYTTPGDYNVELVITNESGCVDTSFCITISVGDTVSPDISIVDEVICAGETVDITNNTMGGFDSWSYIVLGGGSARFCADSSNIQELTLDSGMYDLVIEFDQNGCLTRDTLENAITVEGIDPNPYYETNCEEPMTVFLADSSGIQGDRSWILDGNEISTADSFSFEFPETGDYVVFLEVQLPGSACPPTRDSVLVCVRQIESRFEIDSIQCLKESLDLEGGMSQDVYNSCNRGFKWIFTDQRPITSMFETIRDFNWRDTGIHRISLVVNDINGCTDTLTRGVRIFDVNAGFSFVPNPICLPNQLELMDESTADTSIVTWEWEVNGQMFMDTNPVVDLMPPADLIQVRLSVTDAVGCMHEVSGEVPVYRPVSSIATNPPSGLICLGESITFTATDFTDQGSFLTYEWEFGDGQVGDNQTEVVTYTEPGQYLVKLVYTEDGSGCMDSTFRTVQVRDFPDISFTSDPDTGDVLCAPAVIEFQNTSTASSGELGYFWDFDNGNSSVLENPTEAFEPGTYVVQLVGLDNAGCSDTARIEYEVGGATGDFTVEPSVFCEGEEATFTLVDTSNVSSWAWDFGDGSGLDNESPVTVVFDSIQPGAAVARLLLFSPDGCERVVERSLNIDAINVDFDFSIVLDEDCEPIVFFTGQVLTTLGNFTVDWDFGDGVGMSDDLTPTYRYAQTGTYDVTLTVSTPAGCMESVTRAIEVTGQDGSAGFTADPLFAPDFCLVPWTFADSSSVSTEYVLDFGDGTDTTFTTTGWFVDHNFPMEGDYTVTLVTTNAAGCVDSFSRVISVERNPDFAGGVSMPLAFSPNGDQEDDRFVPYVQEAFEDLLEIETFKVFRQWNSGKLVYDNEDGNQGWNGDEPNGDPAPIDVYYYVISGNVQGCPFRFEGDVTLIR